MLGCGIYMYNFIWWTKTMSFALQGIRAIVAFPHEQKNGGERLSKPLKGTAMSSHSRPLASYPRGATHLVLDFLAKYGGGRS